VVDRNDIDNIQPVPAPRRTGICFDSEMVALGGSLIADGANRILKLDPVWDHCAKIPRFQALIDKYSTNG